MADEIVILKKVNRLEQLKVSPNLYRLNSNNMEDEGELDGIYKGNTFLGSKRNVTPTWDSLKQQWAFDGDIEELRRIQSRLKLRDDEGKLIEISLCQKSFRQRRGEQDRNHPKLGHERSP